MQHASGEFKSFRSKETDWQNVAPQRPLKIRPEGSTARATISSKQDDKHLMSCKSCRVKKIKCSRTKPSCEACELARSQCLYDASPRRRGPNSELLKRMLKRIDDLEIVIASGSRNSEKIPHGETETNSVIPDDFLFDTRGELIPSDSSPASRGRRSRTDSQDEPTLLDAFFQVFHGKPYSFLHESTVRQEASSGNLAPQLRSALHAVSVRYVESDPALCEARSERFATDARHRLDVDEPSLENIQTSILLSFAYFALGQTKKSWMQLGTAIRMTQALGLHREQLADMNLSPLTREIGRRCFWTCYAMDRFSVSGSLRPCLIADESIFLQLPCTDASFNLVSPSSGLFFEELPVRQRSNTDASENWHACFIDILRILGKATRYLQRGGVRGDSHFPWHPMSVLSTIRNDLDTWLPSLKMEPDFTAISHQDSSSITGFLSLCIYHLIHILIYRPFLPFALQELGESEEGSRHQAWQIEATQMCLDHAKSIADLTASANGELISQWPPYVLYCLSSAATVLTHGAHFSDKSGPDCHKRLLQVTQLLLLMRNTWNCAEFHCATVRKTYICHRKLVHQYESEGRYPSKTHQDDFFDRYSGLNIDPCYLPFSISDNWTDTRYAGPDDLFSAPELAGVRDWPIQIQQNLPQITAAGDIDMKVSQSFSQPLDTTFSQPHIDHSSHMYMEQGFGVQNQQFDTSYPTGTYDQMLTHDGSTIHLPALQNDYQNSIVGDSDPLMELLKELAESEATSSSYSEWNLG